MQLVLEICDPKTECVKSRVEFEVADVDGLAALLKIGDFDPFATYDLDKKDTERLKAYANVQIESGSGAARLRRRQEYDDLPYLIHTNRELELMLKGVKPLASFVGQYPPNPDIEEIPERLFDPYVNDGRFVKREYVELGTAGDTLRLRRVLYALPVEAWRIDAYILMRQAADKSGWNEGFERMEGALLGYTEWQNDAHLEKWRVD